MIAYPKKRKSCLNLAVIFPCVGMNIYDPVWISDSANVSYDELGLSTDYSEIMLAGKADVYRRNQAIISCFVADSRLEISKISTENVCTKIDMETIGFFLVFLSLLKVNFSDDI